MLTLILLQVISLSYLMGVEVAPRITDREIVERLAKLEEGQKSLEKRIDDLRSEMNSRFEAVDKRFDSIEKRFDLLQWMFGIFITVSIVILGFVVRMQWQMQKRQISLEKSLETQKDEMAFLKNLIEKLLPPRGAL